jgi:hypothetical protein
MTRLYMISTYEEDGPEEIKCCVSKEEVPALLRSYPGPHYNGADPTLQWVIKQTEEREAYLREVIATAETLLSDTGTPVNEAHNLHRSWGGFQLTILEPT